MRRLLGLILARAGSKRVPDKNARPLAGSSLIERAVACARAARSLDIIGFSSDSERYRALAHSAGLDEAYVRPTELAGDDASSAAAALDYVAWREHADRRAITHVVLLQPTSPLRSAVHVDAAIDTWRASGRASLVSAIAVAPKSDLIIYMVDGKIRRHPADAAPTYVLDGAIYIAPVDQLRTTGCFWNEDSALYVMHPPRPWDIDTEEDFAAAAALIAAERHP